MLEFGKMTIEDHKEALRYLQDYKHLLEDKKFFAYRHHDGKRVTGYVYDGLVNESGFLLLRGIEDIDIDVNDSIEKYFEKCGFESDNLADPYDREVVDFIKKHGIAYTVSYGERYKITNNKEDIESIAIDFLNDGQESIHLAYNEAVEELEGCIKNGTKNELLVKFVLEKLGD